MDVSLKPVAYIHTNNMPTTAKKCSVVKGKLVCGMLKGGGTVPKAGVYMLHKNEEVFTPSQLKKKVKVTTRGKKHKCACKH